LLNINASPVTFQKMKLMQIPDYGDANDCVHLVKQGKTGAASWSWGSQRLRSGDKNGATF
jgi:hypothetical protein